ncbi:hypothetical protein C4561_04245 [candidate division WWE3 bacterium]|uniref:Uncharacterized protein n=1 Tax=candidate division WWE3 bacterium TaxID=2053526 RepID=A0A3A4ZCZ3_UNCKA|nr:MAG: hypothetical protein C4561_04245 [candidate division WWE3 bacterium]
MNQSYYTVNKFHSPSSILKEIQLLTCIRHEFYTTMYFYNRENKIVFPVDVDKVYDCISEPVKILLGVLSVAGIHIVGIQISGSMSEDKPNTYLIAEINSELSKIQTDFFESIKLAANLKIPIMIEENILTFQGIKITKELLENSLAID